MNSRTLSACLAYCLGILNGHAAQPPESATDVDEVVQMSPFEVHALSIDFQHWIKVGSANFILYTDAGTRLAEETLRELEMVRAATARFFGRAPLQRSPMIVVLPTATSDWRKVAAVANVEWRVAVSLAATRMVDLIVSEYDWQRNGLSSVWSMQAMAELRHLSLGSQLWFVRGVGTFFETIQFMNNSVRLGRDNPRTRRLVHDNWLTWDRFFAVTGESPEFITEAGIHRYQGQCALFVHYLLTQEDLDGGIDKLVRWAAYLDAGNEPDEAEFTTIFGQDWQSLQRRLAHK